MAVRGGCTRPIPFSKCVNLELLLFELFIFEELPFPLLPMDESEADDEPDDIATLFVLICLSVFLECL